MENDRSTVLEIDDTSFEREVLGVGQPALVSFEAPWSKPCKVVHSALSELAVLCGGKARVFRVNVDDNPDLGVWYDVQAVPTLVCFVNGQERARIVGTASAEAVWRKMGAFVTG